ncbi:hypothetical protein HPB51_025451 [Rhipicephalus microplus]|uniref:EXS domain-containing protein n=1 Tax=Rhipicephalus microplus TaxID=6941 RepID=A0A9J6EKA0_RHIMP|nr:hypothetical protein HPB51_025451 [Rhipicephalus microplus]
MEQGLGKGASGFRATWYDGVFSQTRDDWRIVFRLYRGTLLIILFMFLIGVNVYGWRTSGVNHVLIFELDPRNHLSEQHLMEVSGTITLEFRYDAI